VVEIAGVAAEEWLGDMACYLNDPELIGIAGHAEKEVVMHTQMTRRRSSAVLMSTR